MFYDCEREPLPGNTRDYSRNAAALELVCTPGTGVLCPEKLCQPTMLRRHDTFESVLIHPPVNVLIDV